MRRASDPARVLPGRTRVLVYLLLFGCALAVLFGPQLASRGLELLGCSAGYGAAAGDCGGVTGAVAGWLAPWRSAAPPLETLFVLIEQGGWGLAVFGVLILLSRRADARAARASASAAVDAPLPHIESPTPARPERLSMRDWVRAREVEQREEAIEQQRSALRRLVVERSVWGGMALTSLLLLYGLVVFCVAFGVPLLGGLSADALLSAFGCKGMAGVSPDSIGPLCGFWIERLAPYRQPFLGALLSPLWLFTQFHDLLLVWTATILLLLLLPLYRLGWVALALKEQALAVRLVFLLVALCSIGMLGSLVMQPGIG